MESARSFGSRRGGGGDAHSLWSVWGEGFLTVSDLGDRVDGGGERSPGGEMCVNLAFDFFGGGGVSLLTSPVSRLDFLHVDVGLLSVQPSSLPHAPDASASSREYLTSKSRRRRSLVAQFCADGAGLMVRDS
jgi:hypothetical protein